MEARATVGDSRGAKHNVSTSDGGPGDSGRQWATAEGRNITFLLVMEARAAFGGAQKRGET